MRTALWPDHTAVDRDAWLARPDTTVLVAEREPGRLVGFAELGLRSHADGCDSSPVPYLEGWWVDPEARRQGVGRALMAAADAWARAQGYAELASDTPIANIVSQAAHTRLGFAEVERAVLYRKALRAAFIDDAAHLARLEGQRFVVLRPNGDVHRAYCDVRARVRERLRGLDVSYPAEPHVTLAGFGRGTSIEAARDLAGAWASTIAPLTIRTEAVSTFQGRFQIIIIRVQRTAELVHALTSLRGLAAERGVTDVAAVAPSDWTFHMSVAYCSGLDPSAWTDVARWAETVPIPSVACTVGAVEIAAFDNGREHGAGVVTLTAGPAFE
jgi:aminoglycoside 6'-N-acetyltransferase I